MLNKGPYVMEAVHVLDDILRRMHGHQEKKRSVLRELQLMSRFRQTLKTRSQPIPGSSVHLTRRIRPDNVPGICATQREPGVVVFWRQQPRRRVHRTLRIPESVA